MAKNKTTELMNRLASGQVLLSDGAIGTEFLRKGFPINSCYEELNFVNPDIVKQVYLEYLNAGSDIIQTNSFGANRARLSLFEMEDRVRDFSKMSVELALEVTPEGKYVAGSMGPTGEVMQPFGPLTPNEAYDIFSEQAEALAEAGADIIFIETMSSVEEAVSAIRAVKNNTSLAVSVSMTFEAGGSLIRTMWGAELKDAVAALDEAGADIIGANCGRGFDEMIRVMEALRPLTQKAVVAQPNAGIPRWVNGRSIYQETPSLTAPKVEKLIDIGVNIIGGCCGTTPGHIAAFRSVIDSLSKTGRRESLPRERKIISYQIKKESSGG